MSFIVIGVMLAVLCFLEGLLILEAVVELVVEAVVGLEGVVLGDVGGKTVCHGLLLEELRRDVVGKLVLGLAPLLLSRNLVDLAIFGHDWSQLVGDNIGLGFFLPGRGVLLDEGQRVERVNMREL